MNYEIMIEHTMEGICLPGEDYDETKFDIALPLLLEVANILKDMNMFPRVGDKLYADGTEGENIKIHPPETAYQITDIIYYDDSVKLLVNDDKYLNPTIWAKNIR